MKPAFGLALTYTMLLHDLFIHLTQLVFISCNLFGCRVKGVIYRDFKCNIDHLASCSVVNEKTVVLFPGGFCFMLVILLFKSSSLEVITAVWG